MVHRTLYFSCNRKPLYPRIVFNNASLCLLVVKFLCLAVYLTAQKPV